MKCNYFQQLDGGTVECQLCPHHCRIADGKTGVCRSRRNRHGVLYSEVYGKPCALAIDPVEKKPLYHFHPGTKCLSVACTGCNFRCLNCQNHDISQATPDQVPHYRLSPRQLVEVCEEHHLSGHCLHLHRAAHLHRIRHRCCPSGARARAVEHPRHGRLRLQRTAGRPAALPRRGQR